MTLKLEDVIKKAKELDSYLITITTKDDKKRVVLAENKEQSDISLGDGDLDHYFFTQNFPIDDTIASIDECLRSTKITPPLIYDVIKPKKVNFKDSKPLKIAIITHLNSAPNYFSPARAIKNQVKMLRKYNHEVVVFILEGSKLDFGCEMRPIVPKFKRQKMVVNDEAKLKFIDILREELTNDFNIAITQDLYIDDCITYREAIKECGVDIEWLHWARSGIGQGFDFDMPNARYVYMNYADAKIFAERISVDPNKIRVVFNEKDPSLAFGWDTITEHIVNKAKLWDKDIIQVYPICTTRMDAKGINSVIQVFGKLKELGNKVCLVICNSNGRKRLKEIEDKLNYAKLFGLTNEDIIFTSQLSDDEHQIHSEVPHKVVMELMNLANLFIFPTHAEVCPNILLESAMSKNLLVLNEDLPLLFDFVDECNVMSYPFASHRSLNYKGRMEDNLTKLSKQIMGQIKANKADKQFRKTWKNHRLEAIYEDMLGPILYEKNKNE